jgi:hypothetical protein
MTDFGGNPDTAGPNPYYFDSSDPRQYSNPWAQPDGTPRIDPSALQSDNDIEMGNTQSQPVAAALQHAAPATETYNNPVRPSSLFYKVIFF